MIIKKKEAGIAAGVIKNIVRILEVSNYQNVKYESSDCHAHYFQYENVNDKEEIEKWDLQVEIERNHNIYHKPVNVEDWYYVGETFCELMECYGDIFDIAI